MSDLSSMRGIPEAVQLTETLAEPVGVAVGPGLAEVLDRSLFEAARGARPPARLVRSGPARTWSVLTDRLLAGTRVEYLGFDDPSVLARAGMTESMVARGSAAMKSMLDRGVRLRQLTTRPGLDADDLECPALQHRRGGEVRVVGRMAVKACVFDRRVAVLPLDLAFLPGGMLVFTDPVVVGALARLHRGWWDAGMSPPAVPSGPPEYLRPVLRALHSGATDEAAARAVGLSARTYSRRVAELIRLLDASSRFDAGVRAARRGWL